MKKVKIMLFAILVFAVVAGAMAFKAKKFGSFCLYTLVDNPGTMNDFCSLVNDNLWYPTLIASVTNGQLVAYTPGQYTCATYDPDYQPDGAPTTLSSENCLGQTTVGVE